MWRLVAHDRDGREVARAELDGPGDEIVIGRDPQAALNLPSVGVSRRHARVLLERGELVIVDEQSANGVIVEGERVRGSRALQPGEVVQIAEFLIDVEGSSPSASAELPAGEWWQLVPAPGPVSPRGTPERTHELIKPIMLVGRAAECDIVLEHESVSRRHARLSVRPTGLEVEDLGSQNGTLVAGLRIERAHVLTGQEIAFGDVSFLAERGARSSTAYVSPRAWRRRAVWFAMGGAVLGILILAGAALRRGGGTPDPAPARSSGLERLQADIDEHVERARVAISRRSWSEAADELGLALARDPLNDGVQKLRQRVVREQKSEKRMREAAGLLARGGAEELLQARQIYRAIPGDSAYHPEADLKDREVARQIPELLEREARRFCGGHEPQRCNRLLCSASEARDPAAPALLKKYKATCP